MTQPIASYEVSTRDADQTRAFGEDLGRILAAGDLLMLSGGLGAGKTTLTQGIGVGMGVRGRVASPTFIVARVHPSLSGGPDLIHADAYRITDLNDLETLDAAPARCAAPRAAWPPTTVTSSTWRTWTTARASSSCAPTATAGTASSTPSSPPTAEPASTRTPLTATITPTASRIAPCER